jgi:hypothetical protein
MNYFLFIFVFLIVLFLYLHIYYHLKTSNDLEVYEIELPSKDKLEEICDIRQPVTFMFNNTSLLEQCNLTNIVNHYGAFDVNIRNVKESDANGGNSGNDNNSESESELYIPLVLNSSIDLFNNDKNETYITEKNQDFLEETGLIKIYRHNDEFLRPSMVSKCEYDFLSGSVGTKTPLRYGVDYRNYFLVTHGEIEVVLIPPQHSRYLYGETDYLNFEFKSPINPWNVQDKYKSDYDKVKTLEVTVKKGEILYIPAYWWYSFKYTSLSSACNFKYRTYMNTAAIMPQICVHLLQNTNVKREIVRKRDHDIKVKK